MSGPTNDTVSHPSSAAGGDGGGGVHVLETQPANQNTTESDATQNDHGSKSRAGHPLTRRFRILAVAAVVILAISVGVPYYLVARFHVSTDDAFIEGHVVSVSPRVAGHVAKVCVTDNQWVNAGDLLVELDPRDFEAKLAGAAAELEAARAVAESRSIGVDVTEITSSAGVEEASAALDAAKADVETARAAVTTAESLRARAEAQLLASRAP